MYTNYIFDLYGTLVDIHTNENYKLLWDKLSLFYSFNGAHFEPLELKNKYLEYAKKYAHSITDTKYPDFPIENVFKDLYDYKNVSPCNELVKNTAQIFRTLSIRHLKLYDGVIEFLELLKQNNKKIYLLSNAQKVFTLYEMQILKIEKYFDDIFISSEHYKCKPDTNFFNELIDKHNLDVKQSIMIGNDPITDIEGAKSVGLDTYYIKSNQSPSISLSKINATYKTKEFRNIIDILNINR